MTTALKTLNLCLNQNMFDPRFGLQRISPFFSTSASPSTTNDKSKRKHIHSSDELPATSLQSSASNPRKTHINRLQNLPSVMKPPELSQIVIWFLFFITPVLLLLHPCEALDPIGEDFGIRRPSGDGLWHAVEDGEETKIIMWRKCPTKAAHLGYNEPHCAYVLRRLNPDDDSDKRIIILHVTRYSPQKTTEELAEVQGFVFHIYGGPALNGVERLWKYIAEYTTWSKRHIHVTFNIRGSFGSEPDLSCFENEKDDRAFSAMMLKQDGPSMETAGLAGARTRRINAYLAAERCVKKLGGDHGVLRHVGVGSTAEDILFLQKLLVSDSYPETTTRPSLVDKVNLWTMSWSAHVADYLTKVHPDHLNSVIIDSPLDLDAPQNHKAAYIAKITEVNEVLASICYYCSTGVGCSLARKSGEDLSPEETCARVQRLINYAASQDAMRRLHQTMALPPLRLFLYNCLYKINEELSTCLTWIDILEGRLMNDTPFEWDYYGMHDTRLDVQGPVTMTSAKLTPGYEQILITCADVQSLGIDGTTDIDLYGVWKEASAISTTGADAQFSLFVACAFLRGTQIEALKPIPARVSGINTDTPILFLGNRLDPVAPARDSNGRLKHLDHYPNSYYVEVITTGHTILPHHDSPCLDEAISNYLDLGILPPSHYTSCTPKKLPFDAPTPYEPRVVTTPEHDAGSLADDPTLLPNPSDSEAASAEEEVFVDR
ncbi:hypothetical protein BJ508DRAFT_315097 [Ascobolus immersus RN42]|uniref:Peptidase S33 tripeptidyl aminopeptidase-like C-terminal domain-containing protein n=1 Tax=Ascobolus immersus RN42 TaxID=1160509 RepID=A0A3N4HEI5_ASCIM|nr:hypothetical protein BJ508DRAFT_315097 [Ascobolus immersus RN42]